MKPLAKPLALLALAGTLIAPLLYLFQALGEGPLKLTLLLAAVLWFASAPFWLKGGSQ